MTEHCLATVRDASGNTAKKAIIPNLDGYPHYTTEYCSEGKSSQSSAPVLPFSFLWVKANGKKRLTQPVLLVAILAAPF